MITDSWDMTVECRCRCGDTHYKSIRTVQYSDYNYKNKEEPIPIKPPMPMPNNMEKFRPIKNTRVFRWQEKGMLPRRSA